MQSSRWISWRHASSPRLTTRSSSSTSSSRKACPAPRRARRCVPRPGGGGAPISGRPRSSSLGTAIPRTRCLPLSRRSGSTRSRTGQSLLAHRAFAPHTRGQTRQVPAADCKQPEAHPVSVESAGLDGRARFGPVGAGSRGVRSRAEALGPDESQAASEGRDAYADGRRNRPRGHNVPRRDVRVAVRSMPHGADVHAASFRK